MATLTQYLARRQRPPRGPGLPGPSLQGRHKVPTGRGIEGRTECRRREKGQVGVLRPPRTLLSDKARSSEASGPPRLTRLAITPGVLRWNSPGEAPRPKAALPGRQSQASSGWRTIDPTPSTADPLVRPQPLAA